MQEDGAGDGEENPNELFADPPGQDESGDRGAEAHDSSEDEASPVEEVPIKRPPNPSKLSLRRKDLSVRFNTVPEIFYQTHDYKVRLSHSSDDTAHTTYQSSIK